VLAEAEIVALGQDGHFVRDAWLGDQPALACHAELLALRPALRPAGIGRAASPVPEVRGDRIAWLSPGTGPALDRLFDRFAALAVALREQAWLPIERFDVQLACYAGGGESYARHRDAFAGGPSRRVTAIWYGNPGWRPAHGGQLRLFAGERVVDVEPRLDRLVVFLSAALEHEVLAAHHERFAVTAWYHGPETR
jgi:SM-20-related protein